MYMHKETIKELAAFSPVPDRNSRPNGYAHRAAIGYAGHDATPSGSEETGNFHD